MSSTNIRLAPLSLTKFRSLTVGSTAVEVRAGPGEIYGLNFINLHSAVIYVKLYNLAAASVNPASSVPVHTFLVPATSAFVLRGGDARFTFSTSISVRAVTESGDTGTTAAGTLPILEIDHQAQ